MDFTLDGSGLFEDRISQDMQVIRQTVLKAVGEDSLRALILGGGYGRGEGGVCFADGEERVYNDYDFFVVVPPTSRKRRRWIARQLEDVKSAVEPVCGIHVDFGPPMQETDLSRQPYELMFMELKAGHYVLYGPNEILDALPDYDISVPPLEEGARLFMNRGIGLFMARQLIRKGRVLNREHHEFVVRNIYKAMMAMGDGVLFVERNYDPSYVARLKRIRSMRPLNESWWSQMQASYEDAMHFKFHPSHELPAEKTLQSWYDEVLVLFMEVYLWFERVRLADSELDWEAYQSLPCRLPVLSRADRLKNLYRNMRARKGTRLPFSEYFLHPRDRILKRLPGLLSQDKRPPNEETLVLRLWESYG